MKALVRVLLFSLFAGLLSGVVSAQKKPAEGTYRPLATIKSADLQAVLDRAVEKALSDFESKGLKRENLAATVIDVGNAERPVSASFRGNERIYPASVVKMFYMVALERWLQDGKLTLTTEMSRGLRDMIVDSSNEATQYMVDVLTGTSSGSELPAAEFRKWAYKRNAVNRFYESLGYTNINVNQKTHCEDAYGIEQQFRNYKGENRNMLTTDATARLLAEIVTGRTNTPQRTATMMGLLARKPFAESKDPEDQANGFTGIALKERNMTGAKLWSKAGWTSRSRHDAAYIETPDGLKLVIVVFTENVATERNIIPAIAGRILDDLN